MAELTKSYDAAAYTGNGTARNRVALPADMFDGTVNMPVLHQAVKAFLADAQSDRAVASKLYSFKSSCDDGPTTIVVPSRSTTLAAESLPVTMRSIGARPSPGCAGRASPLALSSCTSPRKFFTKPACSTAGGAGSVAATAGVVPCMTGAVP